MPLFDADNRLTMDVCAVGLKDRGNKDISSYLLTNLRAPCTVDVAASAPLAVAAEHRNLWSWDGYGLNTCAVDADSRLRVDSEVTHMRARMQLPKRVFEASPDLSHGQPAPDAVSKIVYGKEFGGRACDRLAERDWDRFDPGVCKVAERHIIPPWTNGGDASRDIARSDGFLQSLGYANDGKIWRRPS